MKRLLVVASGVLVLVLSTPARGEQQWQCGDGLTVPLTGTRADREAACRDAKERRANPPDATISQEQADLLRQRLNKIEKDQGVQISVDKLDKVSPPKRDQGDQPAPQR
ncbi:MAG TPA: hypothetical protein VGK30_18855 [Candidatus Binatia bacterium]|jgi:hypothetical protein